jgi:alanyl-tRNA synthetase
VVSMGGDEHDDHVHPFSVELCGGTHVRRTGDIGFFKIINEGAVASGVRRIEAVTGPAAEEYVDREEGLLQEAANVLRTSTAELPARLASLLEDRKKLERELSDARRAAATGGGGAQQAAAKDIAGVKFAGRALDGVPAKELKSLADDLKKEIGSGVVALAASAEGKASIVVGVTEDLVKRFSAVDLVRVGSEAVGGKGGGGRPDMAQAGGPDGARINDALAAIEKALAEKAAN